MAISRAVRAVRIVDWLERLPSRFHLRDSEHIVRGCRCLDHWIRHVRHRWSNPAILTGLLTRPRSTALQLAGQELTLRRISRLTPGVAALIWAVVLSRPELDDQRTSVLLIASVAGGASLFAGLIVLAGDPCVLDDRNAGDNERGYLWRSRDDPVPDQHLSSVVPQLLHIWDSARMRQLLPGARDHGCGQIR